MFANARVPQNVALTMTSHPSVGPAPATVDVEDLTWQLLDDRLEEPKVRVLERELTNNDKSRRTYVDCVRLHTDLMFYFREKWNEEHPDEAKPLMPLPFDK
jgi:hypothetical protein